MTDRVVCHHKASARGSKNADMTRAGDAMMEIELVNDGFMTRCRARPPDLIGVLVGVLRVNLEPAVHAVGAVFGMRAGFREVCVRHAIEQVARRAARRLEGDQRAGDRPIVVETPGELLLIVRPNSRVLFGDEQTQPDSRRHLAVGQVVDDLAGTPFVRRRPRVELGLGRAVERRSHFAIPVFVSGDELRAPLPVHRVTSTQYNKNGCRSVRNRS